MIRIDGTLVYLERTVLIRIYFPPDVRVSLSDKRYISFSEAILEDQVGHGHRVEQLLGSLRV